MKKVFKGWTKFEVIFLIVSLCAITICFLFNKDNEVIQYVLNYDTRAEEEIKLIIDSIN